MRKEAVWKWDSGGLFFHSCMQARLDRVFLVYGLIAEPLSIVGDSQKSDFDVHFLDAF